MEPLAQNKTMFAVDIARNNKLFLEEVNLAHYLTFTKVIGDHMQLSFLNPPAKCLQTFKSGKVRDLNGGSPAACDKI